MVRRPQQRSGAQNDTVRRRTFKTEAAAISHFDVVKKRFQDVANWQKLCKGKHAAFTPCDCHGEEKSTLTLGDTIRIFTGTQNTDGDGCDWVRVEALENTDTLFAMRVRPCSAPGNDNEAVAHFYDENATNNFEAERNGKTIVVRILGRNETINTESESAGNMLRNIVVAIGGLLFGSSTQWKSLAKGIIQ